MNPFANFLAKAAGNYLQAKILGVDAKPADILKYTALQQGLGALSGDGEGFNLFGKKAEAPAAGIGVPDVAQLATNKMQQGADAGLAKAAAQKEVAQALARPSAVSSFTQAPGTLGYAKFLTDAGILGDDSKLANLLNSRVGEALATALVSGLGSKMFDKDEQVGPAPTPFGGTEEYVKLNIPRYAMGGTIDGEYFPRRNGGIMPHEGSGQKDDVPAMLMAGEFVLTKDAVKGLGNGDSKKGIEKAYTMMRSLEKKANNYV